MRSSSAPAIIFLALLANPCTVVLAQSNSCSTTSGIDVGNEISQAVAAVVGVVPGVGSLLSGVVNVLYPLISNAEQPTHRDLSECAWQSIVAEINSIVSKAVDQQELQFISENLQSLQDSIKTFAQYVDAVGWYNASLDHFLDWVFDPAKDKDAFFRNAQSLNNPSTFLPVIMPAGTLEVAAYQEMYCNGSLYNAHDPQDKNRPCSLQNLKDKVQTYHDLMINTTQGYINWYTSPNRAAINDDEYINRKLESQACGCVACYCGHVYVDDAYFGGTLSNPTTCWESGTGACSFFWAEDAFGYPLQGEDNHATVLSLVQRVAGEIPQAYQGIAMFEMSNFTSYIDNLAAFSSQLVQDPTTLCGAASIVRTQPQPFPGHCDITSNEYKSLQVILNKKPAP